MSNITSLLRDRSRLLSLRNTADVGHYLISNISMGATSGANPLPVLSAEGETAAVGSEEAGSGLPRPNLMILRKSDTASPSRLEAAVTWSSK